MSNSNMNKEFTFVVNPIFTLVEDKCSSTLITIANYNLLFDCGWNEKFSQNIKTKYEKKLKNIKLDSIFLSNNSISYYGALPLIKSFPENSETKVYATTPIVKLGVYSMIDTYISNLESDEKSLDHISISQETLLETFYKIHEINYLQPIKIKKEQNIENNIINNINNINNEDDGLTIVSYPSGSSLGGASWTCSYFLFNFIYASEYSIEQKIISDPFPYKKLKKFNFLITDNKYQKEIPVLKKVINEDFEKKVRESLEEKKSIFVPTDNINSMLEMVMKFGKLLDEYKENYAQNRTERPEYKILICNNCSSEIIEAIKSLTEFLGNKINQKVDKAIDLEDVICIKNIDEYNNEMKKINMKYIILASFESLNIGLGYSLLPFVLNEKNFVIINIYKDIDYYSTFNEIIKVMKCEKSNEKIFKYKNKRVIETKIAEKKEEKKIENNEEKKDEQKLNITKKKSSKVLKMKTVASKKKKVKNIITKPKMVVEKKKLFNTQINNDYLSFNFTPKIRYTDYGVEFSKAELKLMKQRNESINLAYDSNFLNTDKNYMKLELPQFKIPTKLNIRNIEIEIKCELYFYPLINKIDFMSKKLIIEEINPKDGVILIGHKNELSDWLSKNNINCYDLSNSSEDIYKKEIKLNLIEFNYTSNDLYNGNKFKIDKSDKNVYSFDSLLLSIKTKRDKIIDVSIMDKNKYKKLSENKKEKIKIVNDEDENNKILSKNHLKLINIKHQLEDGSDIKLILSEQKLRNLDNTVVISIKDGELVLEGEFSEQYFKIKSKINDIYFNYTKDK